MKEKFKGMEAYRRKKSEYERTLKAIMAVKNHLEYEFGCKVIIGKGLIASDRNKICTEGTEITPDIVAYNENCENNFLVEVKSALSNPNNRSGSVDYAEEIKQLLKYDDNLKGWKNDENLVLDHSTIAILQMDWCQEFVESFKNYLQKNNINLDKELVILFFTIDDGVNFAVKFQKKYGDAGNKVLPYFNKRSTLSIGFNFFLNDLMRIRVYDDPPPTPYLMSLLFTEVFNQEPTPEQRRDAKAHNKSLKIRLTLEEIENKFVEKCGPPLYDGELRQKKLPKIGLIREAMDRFVSIGYAKKVNSSTEYEITLKKLKIRGNLDEHFYGLLERKGRNLDEFLEDKKNTSKVSS